ncbi:MULTISPECIES: L-threonylcarbamoyladenylate synthase [Caldisericum]|jgi:L-threonylcarbamoyladenylate synthase|uniref:L-threonylcarbamoyladenylate synthase n=1 Tax=Caldisericum exile TaxID=693075 RepID=A0A2J6X7G2_9BACT|nr:MAG: threonylcarbamoyl-AMP synthase [Caldisericum exile]
MKRQYEEALKHLNNHGVIAFKTDTVMGLGVNGLDNIAVKNLFDIKGRSYDKPLYLLAYSIEQIYDYVYGVTEEALSLMEKHFPGALAIILRSQKKLYTKPNEKGETLGVRIPNYPDLLDFLAFIKLPILNTSANISNSPPLLTKESVIQTFDDKVLYIEFEHDIEMLELPSTVVDLTSGKPTIIRKGAVEI